MRIYRRYPCLECVFESSYERRGGYPAASLGSSSIHDLDSPFRDRIQVGSYPVGVHSYLCCLWHGSQSPHLLLDFVCNKPMASIHPANPPLSDYSELANAVPLEERLRLPQNEPVPYPEQDPPTAPVDPPAPNPPALNPPAPNPPNHPQGQVPDELGPIDPHLVEITQRPYYNGLFHNDAPAEYIPYGPSGFTVSKLLAGDSSEVVDANDQIPTTGGRTWPKKMAFHFEFEEDGAYSAPLHLPQQNVRTKRGGFALRAAEEVQKMLAQRPQFPFTLNQLKVVGIHVRSRGTVQARLYVSAEDWHAQFADSPQAAT